MALLNIPLRNDLESYTFTVTLDARSYIFKVDWNTRDSRWYLTIRDANGTDLVTAIPLLADTPLLERFRLTTLPQGGLYLLDSTGAAEEATKDGLGTRWTLLYQEAS